MRRLQEETVGETHLSQSYCNLFLEKLFGFLGFLVWLLVLVEGFVFFLGGVFAFYLFVFNENYVYKFVSDP